MNNAQLNHFSRNPINLDISRSLFQRPFRTLCTFMHGRLVPLLCEPVLPGDSVKIKLSTLVRTQTPIHPTMDNLLLDVHAYFVPYRILWEHWKQFMMENTASYWAPSVTYTIPQITAPPNKGDGVSSSSVKGWAKGTLMDYLGVPTKVGDISVSHLPVRAYISIWNNYYRDQNTMSPASFNMGDSTVTGNNAGMNRSSTSDSWIKIYNNYISTGSYVGAATGGGALLPVCRLHDWASSCLPAPQKGPTVLMPLGDTAPVVNDTSSSHTLFSPIWYANSGTLISDTSLKYPVYAFDSKTATDQPITPSSGLDAPIKIGLLADLSQATAASVNQLREAFMVQRIYEALARSGSRYFEFIRAFFGVRVPDATVQIPEYLFGRRIPINIIQVAQTSASTSGVTPQGNVAAYSLTTDTGYLGHKSFTEHGLLMVLGCVRAEHSYSQGLPRWFTKKTFFEFYNPKMANAPEQPVYKSELCATGSNGDSVFGYNEAWYEYRYGRTTVSGEMKSNYAQSLDIWHYGDYYVDANGAPDAPTLSVGWMMEPANYVERTLAIKDQDQYLGDFYFDTEWARAMPVYSIPGLLDHH